ncbi:3737_t:CDS:2 [Paraglomus brasilianum]|uniref:3737_t:CDS:1 n=1 Tax=Paraglomus brasilianum TaxID=144538 RepID=A0A9N9BRR7_9GLOM|nr:3737_t:CDS:2 [Paraglomus brasilianum]
MSSQPRNDRDIIAWIYDKLSDAFNGRAPEDDPTDERKSIFLLSLPGLSLNPNSYDPNHRPGRDEKTAQENLTDLVDAIPLMKPQYVRTQKTVSSMYAQLLQTAKLPEDVEFEKNMEKAKEWEAYLYRDDGSKTPQYQQYLDGAKKYNEAVIEFNSILAGAKQADNFPDNWKNDLGPKAQAMVDKADNDWKASGKRIIENVFDELNTISESLPTYSWSHARDKFDRSALVSTTSATSYYPCSVMPNDWYTLLAQEQPDASRWTSINIQEGTDRTSLDNTFESTSTSIGGSGSYQLWSIGGGYSDQHKHTTEHSSSDDSKINIDIKCLKVTIQRDWLDASLLEKKFWSMEGVPKYGWSTGSIEAANRRGEWSLIPTDFIVARDIKITAGLSSSEQQLVTDATHKEAHLSVGWGPFAISGSYSKDTAESHSTMTKSDNQWAITCENPQIIGWICTVVPAAPSIDG